jgi:hypothetical protein
MKTKDRKSTSAGQRTRRQTRAERQAVKKFNAELQKAVDKVDWAKLKLLGERPLKCILARDV